jgi:hypothetical protein
MNQDEKPNKTYDANKTNIKLYIQKLDQAYAQIVNQQLKTLKRDEAIFRLQDLGKLKLNNFLEFIRYISQIIYFDLIRHKKILATIGAGCCLTFLFFIVMAIVVPQSINFTYSKKQSCIFSPVLFPSTFEYTSAEFNLTRPSSFSIGGISLFSTQLCAVPNATFTTNNTYKNHQTFELFKTSLVGKTVSVNTQSFASAAVVNYDQNNHQPLALLVPLRFELSSKDEVFDYALAANDRLSVCNKQNRAISCSLLPLNLSYEQTYQITLVRLLNKRLFDTVWSDNITTVSAIAVVNTSVGDQTVVYDSPNQITLETNKPLTSVRDARLEYLENDAIQLFPIDITFEDRLITIKFGQPLIRQKTYNLFIDTAVATDNSLFEQPYRLTFSTSGGPQVVSTNAASAGVDISSDIIVYLDQPLDASQPLQDAVSLKVNGVSQPAHLSINDSAITINPDNNFTPCTTINITFSNDIKNSAGISGNSAWDYNFRTTCRTTFSIGTSMQGRPIIASQFGSANTTILFIGAMHGNETNSQAILEKWIDELDTNPDKIPSSVSVVIIPSTNPDGVANGSRLNARGINLNRNFPTDDWSHMVIEPGNNGILTGAGGLSPLSEPESAALANYVQSHNIRFAVTYHSSGGLVQSNVAGNAETVGKSYASRVGYRFVPAYSIGNVFDYSICGAFEDWIGQKLNIPGLLVELDSSWNDEFWQNQPAMWDIVRL